MQAPKPLLWDDLLSLSNRTSDLPPHVWREQIGVEGSRVMRDMFLNWVCAHPVDGFEQVADHPFWTNWRSQSGENNILYFALGRAKDPRWISCLVEAGVVFEPYFMRQVISQPLERIVPTLQMCHQLNLWKPEENGENQRLFERLLSRGSLDFAQFMWEHNAFKKRINGAQAELAAFQSRGRTTPNTCEILNALWDQWGLPSAEEFRTLFAGIHNFVSSEGSSRGNAYALVARHWNNQHPQWTDDDTEKYLRVLMEKSNTPKVREILAQKIKDGVFSEELWDRSLNKNSLTEKTRAVLSHLYLSVHLDMSSAPAHRKRM